MHGRRHHPTHASLARALVGTAEIVGFSVVAHAATGGALPDPDHLTAVAVVVGAVSLALRSRLLSIPVTAAVAVAAQAVVHAMSTGHGLHPSSMTEGGAGMLLAHGLSALFTVLALVWQEQTVVAAARVLTESMTAALPILPGRPVRLVAERNVRAHPGRRVTCRAPRRGPPASVVG